MRTLILVTGQHRSGTSAAAGCLQHLGVNLGTCLMPGNHANPKGYFEDMRVVKAHDKLLEAVGASWDRPHDVPADWRKTIAADVAAADLTGILLQFKRTSKLFAIKDPRAVLFMRLWQEVCERASVRLTLLIPKRLNEASARSLMRREGWPEDRAKAVIFGYQDAIEAVSPEIPSSLILFPDGLWRASCWERVAGELGVSLDIRDGMAGVLSFLDWRHVHNG